MDDLEREAMKRLSPGRVCYAPGSWAKRFGRAMAAKAEELEYTLSDKQREMVWRMVHRFRRQIGSKRLVAYAVQWLFDHGITVALTPRKLKR